MISRWYVYAESGKPGAVRCRWLGEVDAYATAEAWRYAYALGDDLQAGERLVLVLLA